MSTTIFTNVRVIDGSGDAAFSAEVSVQGNRIEEIARDAVSLVDPIEEITHKLTERLGALQTSLDRKFAAAKNARNGFSDKLKSGSRDLRRFKRGTSIAADLKKHVSDANKLHDKKQKLVSEALEKLRKSATTIK